MLIFKMNDFQVCLFIFFSTNFNSYPHFRYNFSVMLGYSLFNILLMVFVLIQFRRR